MKVETSDKTVPAIGTSTNEILYNFGLYAVEECTAIANEFGGDFGEDFYIYFEELFENVI